MQYFNLMYKANQKASVVRANRPRGELLKLVPILYPHFKQVSLHNWQYSEANEQGENVITAEVYLEPGRKCAG